MANDDQSDGRAESDRTTIDSRSINVDDSPSGQVEKRLTRRSVLRTAGVATALNVFADGVAANSRCRGSGDGSSPPPGPPALYDQPASAPQFENGDGWSATPLRVSGADAYVDGEYLFQDFIYDDKGANTTAAPEPPHPKPKHHDFGPMTGDVVYPEDEETYAHNAADLLEFRTRLVRRRGELRVAYRITLNTMLETDTAAIAIGIVTDGDGDRPWGYGLGDLGVEVDHLLVTWGTDAELDGESLPDDAFEVYPERNQIEVVTPLTPGDDIWRHYLVTGLWDGENASFKQIQEQPSDDQPGGAHGKNPPPVFNVGFRYNDQEPLATPNVERETFRKQIDEAVEERTGSRGIGYGHWREHAQANALTDRDISRFHADVDFGKLRREATERNTPGSGYINRIYASNYELDDGEHPSAGIGPYVTEDGDDNNGEDVIRGRLVPYSLYIPESYDGAPMPFHIHLHSLSGNYNQWKSYTPNFLRQLGDQHNTIVMTPSGRGPGVPYRDQAELDVFEAWGDVAARYSLDLDRVTLGGYSMGGIGTHQLASKWPDLFARAFPIVGSLGDEYTGRVAGDDLYTNNELIAINQRHVPLLMWQGTSDELVPFPLVVKYEQQLRDLGLRHELDVFPGFDHVMFAYLDQWGPAAEFLDDATVERTPPRITYRTVRRQRNKTLDLVHDHVYWASNIEIADGAPHGFVDVRSLGFGEASPIVATFERDGTDPYPHTKRGVAWKEPLIEPAPENALEIQLEDVSAVTIWVDEAALDAGKPIELTVDSTVEATITLASELGEQAVTVPAGETERTVQICERPKGRT